MSEANDKTSSPAINTGSMVEIGNVWEISKKE